MRLLTRRRIYGHQPFAGQGTSVYLASGATDPGADAIPYRRMRIDVPRYLGTLRTSKTARVASADAPATAVELDVSALAGLALRVQARPYRDNVELRVIGGSRLLSIDGGGEDATGVQGLMTLLEVQLRAGGDVRIRTVYRRSLSGAVPTLLTAARTAGPTTPENVALTFDPDEPYYDFDFVGLSAGTYTFRVFATSDSVDTDLLTGISASPDVSGPPAPTGSVIAA